MPVTHYWEKINHVKFGHMKNAKKTRLCSLSIWYLNEFQRHTYKIKQSLEVLLQNTEAGLKINRDP